MLEILLGMWLANIIPGAPSPVDTPWDNPSLSVSTTLQTADKAICEAQALGFAASLPLISPNDFNQLDSLGFRLNPKNLHGEGCVIALTNNVHEVGSVDGVKKTTAGDSTRYAVVWRAN